MRGWVDPARPPIGDIPPLAGNLEDQISEKDSQCTFPQLLGSLYTRTRPSTLSDVTSSLSFFFSAPAIAPRTV